MLITTFSHLIWNESHFLDYRAFRWSNRELIKSSTFSVQHIYIYIFQLLNWTFGVTLHQIKLFSHSLWNCVVLMKFTLVNFLEVFPPEHFSRAHREWNPNLFPTPKMTVSIFLYMNGEFNTFHINCLLVYDFKKKKNCNQEITVNTCCHKIILCTLQCKLSTRPLFKSIPIRFGFIKSMCVFECIECICWGEEKKKQPWIQF